MFLLIHSGTFELSKFCVCVLVIILILEPLHYQNEMDPYQNELVIQALQAKSLTPLIYMKILCE